MKKPIVILSHNDLTTVGKVFGTPLVIKGKTWFPLTEFVVWAVMTWVAGRGYPQRSLGERLDVGALTTLVILGSEWCHNLAHAVAAKWVGKPMDALRIAWGMPLVIYKDVNDETVTPHQHRIRALGGPLFNALMVPFAYLFKRFTQPDSMARDVANAAVGMNIFLCTASLLPIPGIDGGPILKWSLVERGDTPQEADEKVKQVNKILSGGLWMAAGIAIKKRSWFIGTILGMFAALALAIGFGLIKEQE